MAGPEAYDDHPPRFGTPPGGPPAGRRPPYGPGPARAGARAGVRCGTEEATAAGSRSADAEPARGLTAAAAALLVLSLAAFAAACVVLRLPMTDVLVYRAEGRAVAHGTDLYGFTVSRWRLPATYPPFAALLFVPLGALSVPAVKSAFLLGNVALTALLVRLSLRLVGLPRRQRHRTPALLAGTAVALWLEPVFQTVLFGQINLVLVCLVLWDLGRPDGARGKGLAIGLAAGIKLTPALFAVHLLLTGRVRAGLTALGGFAGTVAAAAFVLPQAGADFFTRRIFETSRVGKAWIVDNQSLQGLADRLAHTAHPGPLLWPAPAVLLAVAGLALARHVHLRHGRQEWGLLVTALTGLLVSPISWSHHWVWCLPLLAVLGAGAYAGPAGAYAGPEEPGSLTGAGEHAGGSRTRRARQGERARRVRWVCLCAVAAVFTARSLWLVPKAGDGDLRLAWWWQVPASPYPLLALAVLAGAASAFRRYSAPGSDSDSAPDSVSARDPGSEPRSRSDGASAPVPKPAPSSASAADPAPSPASSRSWESTIR